jgi:hypothetical protein
MPRQPNSQAGGQATARAVKLIKMSLHVPEGLHWRLTAIAAREGRDRSIVAAELLNKALARHPLDKVLRGLTGDQPEEDEAVA